METDDPTYQSAKQRPATISGLLPALATVFFLPNKAFYSEAISAISYWAFFKIWHFIICSWGGFKHLQSDLAYYCHCFDTMMVFSLFVGPKDRVYWMNATRFYLQYEWANWVYFRRRAVVPLTIDWSCTWTSWDLVAFEAFFPNTKCGKTPLAFFLPSAWQRTCDLCSNHFFPQHTVVPATT